MADSWSSSIDLHLDWARTARPARALADALRAAIRSGRMRPGTSVPSTRALAADLGLARGTVSGVYADLAAEGYLTIRHGAPTRVAAGLNPRPRRRAPATGATREPTRRWNLGPGQPDLSAFPRAAWLTATRRVLAGAATESLAYHDPLGHPHLRRVLAGYLRRTRGVLAEPEQVVVGSGFAHLLAWWAHVVQARGGRAAAFENPSLPDLREVAAAAGLGIAGVDVDDEGMRVADIDVPAVVVTPAHHYPLGVTLAPDRRAALARQAVDGGRLVLEDDYDGEFRFDRRPVGALQAMAPEHIIYAGTASKTLAPGLRLAWLVVPPRLLGDFRATAVALGERHPSSIDQLVLADLMATGAYDRHVRRMRGVYRRRRDRVLAAVDPALARPDIAAGLHLALQFPPDGPDEATITRVARRHALEIGLLAPNWHDPRAGRRGVVVGFAAPPDHAFTPTLQALQATLAELLPQT